MNLFDFEWVKVGILVAGVGFGLFVVLNFVMCFWRIRRDKKKRYYNVIVNFEEISKVSQKLEASAQRIENASRSVCEEIANADGGSAKIAAAEDQAVLMTELHDACSLIIEYVRVQNDFVSSIFHDIGYIKRDIVLKNARDAKEDSDKIN